MPVERGALDAVSGEHLSGRPVGLGEESPATRERRRQRWLAAEEARAHPAPVDPEAERARLARHRAALAARARPGAVLGLAAVATRLAGSPYDLLVFLAVFLGGVWLFAWADAAPR